MKNKDKSQNGGIQFNKAKLFFGFYPWWRRIRKAKKMTNAIIKDPTRYTEQQRFDFAKKVAGKLMKLLNVRVNVFGIENWLDRGVVLISNHQSNLDPIALLALNDYEKQQPIGFIAKKELWEKKVVKYFMNLTDNLPLDRKSPRNALKIMKEAKELVAKYKRSICVFPEGTRSHSQEMGEFQAASTKLAQMAYAPIIPVSIIDSYKICDKKRPKKLDIKIVFGRPMMPDKFISMRTDDLSKNVKREIQKGIDKYKDLDLNTIRKNVKSINKKSNCYFY